MLITFSEMSFRQYLNNSGRGSIALVVFRAALVGAEDFDGGEASYTELSAERLVNVAIDPADIDDALKGLSGFLVLGREL